MQHGPPFWWPILPVLFTIQIGTPIQFTYVNIFYWFWLVHKFPFDFPDSKLLSARWKHSKRFGSMQNGELTHSLLYSISPLSNLLKMDFFFVFIFELFSSDFEYSHVLLNYVSKFRKPLNEVHGYWIRVWALDKLHVIEFYQSTIFVIFFLCVFPLKCFSTYFLSICKVIWNNNQYFILFIWSQSFLFTIFEQWLYEYHC